MSQFMKHISLLVFLLLTGLSQAKERPNIIVFYTDDHGYADLSCQGVLADVRTPHVDALAKNGVLARNGYSTAPQCVPSRAGLMIGKFQSRFGVETNGNSLDGFDDEQTIAERLQKAGYVTAQFGKWHLGPTQKITDHGFKHVYSQNSGASFAANITIDGKDQKMQVVKPTMYHIDGCSTAAASIIERYKDQPIFLYVAYRAPHVPLDATKKYLERFPGEMPERRRQALAMLSAVDDGVGLITQTLAKHQLTEKTLIFYIGDNGAPLKIHKLDAPGGGPGWDGSLNDPLNGEKGMLAEGGMHVPFIVSWPGRIPAGELYDHPISALDVAATAAELAGIESQPNDFDGVNLIPFLTGENMAAPHEFLTWRWGGQSAIRAGKWKFLKGGIREYLYDLEADIGEQKNLLNKHPEIGAQLRSKLANWAVELNPPGLDAASLSTAAKKYFDFYLDGKPLTQTRAEALEELIQSNLKRKQQPQRKSKPVAGWLAGGTCSLALKEGSLIVTSSGRDPHLSFRLPTELTQEKYVLKVTMASSSKGSGQVFWQEKGVTPTFFRDRSRSFNVQHDGKPHEYSIPFVAKNPVVAVRVDPSNSHGKITISQIRLLDGDGKKVYQWQF